MAEVKWIKITTDIFDDEKILLIESLPDAYAIITVWFKLLCLAGKMNNSGVFLMSNRVAYTDKMLATIFRMKESTVQLALQTFEQFGMVEIIDGVITIPNWNKHQTLDAHEKKKERDRLYQAERRANQRALIAKSSDSQQTPSSYVVVSEEDKEEDIESEKEENTLTASKDAVCSTEVQRVIQAWNALGISRINKIVPNTQRYNWLRKRIKDYGIDTVIEAIEKAKQSDWLMGKNKNGWTITFDWFIRPNNFPKVLDGNYDNNTRKTGRKEPVPTWVSDDLDRAERILEHQKKTVGNDPELSARAESLKERLGK